VLKLNGEIESTRNVIAFVVHASLIRAANGKFIDPESVTAGIRLAIQEVEVVQPHKEAGRVDWIDAVRGVIVGYGDGRGRLSTYRAAGCVAESGGEGFRALRIGVVDDKDRHDF